MKKFYAGTTKGVSATQIKATDLLAISIDATTTTEDILNALAGAKVSDLVNNALSESRAAYAITSQFNLVKETIANALQSMFMNRVNEVIKASMDDMELLESLAESGKISRDVVEYVEDMVKAQQAEQETPKAPVQPVEIDPGINLTSDQVLSMMAARGLTIGGMATAKVGTGTVLGFKVGQAGTMVVMSVDGEQLTVMASSIDTKNQTKNVEENVQMTNNANQVGTAPSLVFVAPVNEEAQAVVDSAVTNNEATPWEEMTAEERAAAEEAKLQADLIRFQEAQETKSAHASTIAQSSAAQFLKGLGGSAVPQTPAAPAPAAPQLTGAPVVPAAPARQTRPASAPAQNNNQNQNNGGNVQMTNNNVQTQGAAQGRQGSTSSPAFGGQQVGRQGSTPSLVLDGAFGAAPSTGSAWANVAPVMALPTEEFTGTNQAGGQDFVWYIQEAAKYEGQILSLSELAANGFANPHIGITGMKFCAPESVAAFFNREVKADDFMWVEVFFGATSYEFMFSANKGSDYKAMIYSRNIARKQGKGGNWYCEYVTSRRTDKLQVVQQADGVIREARKAWNKDSKAFEIVAEDAPFVVEVGGQGWVNTAPNYGIRIGQQVFVQLMVMFDEQQGLKAARDAK